MDIPKTYPNYVTAATPPSSYAIPFIAKSEASSRCSIMSSVMGLRTYTEKPLCPHMCATNPSYMQVVPCKFQRLSRMGENSSHQHISQRPWNIRTAYWSVTSGRKGLTVFTTCVPWMHNTTWRIQRSGVFKMLKRQRKICTWRIASSNAETF